MIHSMKSLLRSWVVDDRWFGFMGGDKTKAGIKVDEWVAMNYSAVYAAVRLLSDAVAVTPLHLYKRVGKEGKERAVKHPLYGLFHRSANRIQTSFRLKQTAQGHLSTWGNAFLFIDRAYSTGDIRGVWPLTPHRIKINVDGTNVQYSYKMSSGENKPLPQDQLCHIPGFGYDGIIGYNPITLARESIGHGMALQEFGSNFFGNGTHPGLIISHPQSLGPETLKSLQTSMQEAYSGLGNSHKLMVLEEGMKPESVTIPPTDAQYLESRKFNITEIARWWRVPPHMIGDLERATFDNIEHQGMEFVQWTAMPWFTLWETELSRYFLSEKEQEQYFFEFDLGNMLRADSTSRGDYYGKMFNVGAMSINEIRAKENMNPVEGGDEHFVQVNMQPLSIALNPPEPVPSMFQGEPSAGPDGDEEANALWWSERAALPEERAITDQVVALRRVYEPLLAKSIQRVVDAEVKAVTAALDAHMSDELHRDQASMESWMEDYFSKLPAVVSKEVAATGVSYVEAIQEATAKMLGTAPDADLGMDVFARDYVSGLGIRYARKSHGMLKKWLRENVGGEDLWSILTAKIDTWEESRALVTAADEAVRMGQASLQSLFVKTGVKEKRWKARGQSCPFCNSMDGKVVGVEEQFLGDGDVLYAQDKDTGIWMALKSWGVKKHPPIHKG